MGNLQRNVWEGWTPQDFIDSLLMEISMIMDGKSWRKPFKTKQELTDYISEHQPYYKKPIKEVNEYFASRYGLK